MEDRYKAAMQHDDMPYYIESNMNSLFNDGKGNAPVRAIHTKPQNRFVRSHHKPQGMSQSLSENDLQYRRQHRNYRSPQLELKDFERDSPLFGIDNGLYSPSGSPKRGRPLNRTPSPVKLEDIKEDQPMIFPSSSPKRSRSPVKQLFGEKGWLGRSTSMKEMPSEEFRKNGIKHWGGKFKQRVGMMVRYWMTCLMIADLANITRPTMYRN